MVEIDRCPSCESQNIIKEAASLSRIMVWRSSGIDPGSDIQNQKCVCHNCSLVFSSLRLTSQEEINYYTNYRDDIYDQQRDVCTPFYKTLKAIFETALYIKNRQFAIQSLIKKHISLSKIQTLLDFGGDTGELIPSSFKHCDKYVYDLSNKPLIENINILTGDKKFDLIICAHVLEHVSDPSSLIEQLKLYMHSGSFLYLEVPYHEQYPLPPNTFDEHINEWNEKSLTFLLNRHDINIIDMKTYNIYGGATALKTLLKLNGIT